MYSFVALQIADAAFPAGGFAHSGGVEAAVQSGEVDGESLSEFLRSALHAQANGLVPFVLAADRAVESFDAINERCEAFLTNHVARAASARQGKALLASAAVIFNDSRLVALRERTRKSHDGGRTPLCHLAPTFGVVTRCLGIPAHETVHLYLFIALRDLVQSAIRLGLVGPLAGHAALHRLAGEIESTAAAIAGAAPLTAVQTAPLLDLVQMTHSRLYSRLFQS